MDPILSYTMRLTLGDVMELLQVYNKTISDGGITVDFGLSKSILPIDHRIAGDH